MSNLERAWRVQKIERLLVLSTANLGLILDIPYGSPSTFRCDLWSTAGVSPENCWAWAPQQSKTTKVRILERMAWGL